LAKSKNNSGKKHITLFLRIFIAFGALYLVFRGEDFGQLAKTLLGINPLVFAIAIGLYGLAQVFFVMRWQILLRVLSIHIGMGVGLRLHFLGLFYNNCLPSSVGGDLLRAWYITHHVDDEKRVEAALSVFFDRVIGLTGMILMAFIAYWLIPVEGGFAQSQSGSEGGLLQTFWAYRWILIAVFGAVIVVFGAIMANRKGRELLKKLWGRLWSVLKKAMAAAKLFGKSPLSIISAIGMTFLLQGICIIGFYLIGRNMGMEPNIKYYFVFFPISWLIGALPISIGGMGFLEGSLKLLFLRLPGVIESQASALAIFQRLTWLIGSLPGVVIHLLGRHLPDKKAEIFVDSDSDID